MDTNINRKTTITLNLVIGIAVFAFGCGVVWMQIKHFDNRLASVETKVIEIYDYLNPDVFAIK